MGDVLQPAQREPVERKLQAGQRELRPQFTDREPQLAAKLCPQEACPQLTKHEAVACHRQLILVRVGAGEHETDVVFGSEPIGDSGDREVAGEAAAEENAQIAQRLDRMVEVLSFQGVRGHHHEVDPERCAGGCQVLVGEGMAEPVAVLHHERIQTHYLLGQVDDVGAVEAAGRADDGVVCGVAWGGIANLGTYRPPGPGSPAVANPCPRRGTASADCSGCIHHYHRWQYQGSPRSENRSCTL